MEEQIESGDVPRIGKGPGSCQRLIQMYAFFELEGQIGRCMPADAGNGGQEQWL